VAWGRRGVEGAKAWAALNFSLSGVGKCSDFLQKN
jgi:hypothetical protein